MLQGPKKTIQRARQLRKEMSLPEILLWQQLRKKPSGLKFRKQHPAGPYVADFFCYEARLVIEVDGDAHDRGNRPQRDAMRDRWFAARRFGIMRIPARDVLRDLDGVLRGIIARASERDATPGDSSQTLTPLHHLPAAGGPPPPTGEEL